MPKKSKSRAVSQDIFDETYDAIKAQIDLKTFKAADVVKFAALAMRLVEKYPQLSGPEKKDLVVRLATQLVAEIPNLSPDDLAALEAAVSLILPPAIDYIIAASKGQLDLNGAQQQFSSCFPCCGAKKAAK